LQATALAFALFVGVGPAVADDISGWRFDRSLPVGFKAHGLQTVEAPQPVRVGPTSLRFEVRPGDCGRARQAGGWDDCANDRERHELIQRGDLQRPGDEYWYAWSLYLPADWTNIYPVKVALGQFHQPGSSVVWMFQNADGGLSIDNQVAGRTTELVRLIDEADLRARWHDITVHARWSQGDDGWFHVYVNGERRYRHDGRTMTADAVYFKFGVYRSFISRNRDLAVRTAHIAYYDELRRGRSRAAVDIATARAK